MSKKDYSALAWELKCAYRVVRDVEKSDAATQGFCMALGAVSGVLKRDNPRFNEGKFIDAVISA